MLKINKHIRAELLFEQYRWFSFGRLSTDRITR